MSLKKILIINLIFTISIIFTIVAIILFDNYRYDSYNPFEDIREFDGLEDQILEEDDIPKEILQNANNLVSEYKENLKENNINSLSISKIYATIDINDKYVLKYLVSDSVINKAIEEIYIFYDNNMIFKTIKVQYRDITDENFISYNNCLINIKSLNISQEDKDKITQYTKEKGKENWSIGSGFKYEYSNVKNTKSLHVRTEENRIFTINI